jgi:hypothetical protein
MSIPMVCHKCGEVVGAFTGITMLRTPLDPCWCGQCPGAGKHEKPERTEYRRLFGLIRGITLRYPETSTTSIWNEYAGPPNRFFLWCAIVFGTKRWPNGSHEGITINGKWVWWDFSTGFFGDGLAELMKKT